MCKESALRGLGRRFHGTEKEQRAKPEKAPKRGRFIADCQDHSRLLSHLRSRPRT